MTFAPGAHHAVNVPADRAEPDPEKGYDLGHTSTLPALPTLPLPLTSRRG